MPTSMPDRRTTIRRENRCEELCSASPHVRFSTTKMAPRRSGPLFSEKCSRPVSRVLCLPVERCLPFIWTCRHRHAPAAVTDGRCNLPPGDARASSPVMAPVYMILQPMGRTAEACRHVRGELLPRLFTLTCGQYPHQGKNYGKTLEGTQPPAVILCYVDQNLAALFPLGSMVLCVARTFLPPTCGERQTVLLRCKDKHYYIYKVRTRDRISLSGRRFNTPRPILLNKTANFSLFVR